MTSSPSNAAELTYFESSALAKLILAEPGTDLVRELWETAARRLTSVLSYVELRAAIAAAERGGRLDRRSAAGGRRRIEHIFAAIALLAAPVSLIKQAAELADAHGLRGYDAVHLAALLAAGPHVTLISSDRALLRAASDRGVRAVAPGL